MKEQENPKPAGRADRNEIRELIRVKIDIYGLTQEDIEFLKNYAQRLAEEKDQRRNQ